MLLAPAEQAYLSRAEDVGALLARVRYASEDEAGELAAALKAPTPEAHEAFAAAWALAAYAGRLEEAAFADHYFRAFLGSARRFPWSRGDAVWPINDVWRAIEDRIVAHALALVTHDLLTREHFELLYDEALADEAH
jgi:hypothetical protein